MTINAFKGIKISIKRLINNTKTELRETRQLTRLVWASKSRQLTDAEIESIKDQGIDIVRVLFLSTLFIIPGSGFIIILLVKGGKRLGVRFLPSAFNREK